ncbi:MAG: hypothetical protein KBD23_05890 [Gammaproteobacteria bacterium]|nr:hypothetical protein [Gammaproteobacteria bacterium]
MFKLSKQNACNLLGIRSSTPEADLKSLCREALDRYCPTPGEVKDLITQLLVQAYRVLEASPQDLKPAQDPAYGERLSHALYGVSEQGLPFELCGVWLWVFDRSGAFQDLLQGLGFQWASKKGCWFLQPISLPTDSTQPALYKAWDLKRI